MKKVLKVMLYLSFVLSVVSTLFYKQFDVDCFLSLAITFGTVFYHISMRLAVGTIYNKTMKNHVDYTKSWYQQTTFEKNIYKKLNVKQWKNKMPTYESSLFDTKKHSMNEIAQAMCQAEIIHETIILLSFLPIAISKYFGAFWVFFITSVLSALFDLTFVIMQRYNRPRIVRLIAKSK